MKIHKVFTVAVTVLVTVATVVARDPNYAVEVEVKGDSPYNEAERHTYRLVSLHWLDYLSRSERQMRQPRIYYKILNVPERMSVGTKSGGPRAQQYDRNYNAKRALVAQVFEQVLEIYMFDVLGLQIPAEIHADAVDRDGVVVGTGWEQDVSSVESTANERRSSSRSSSGFGSGYSTSFSSNTGRNVYGTARRLPRGLYTPAFSESPEKRVAPFASVGAARAARRPVGSAAAATFIDISAVDSSPPPDPSAQHHHYRLNRTILISFEDPPYGQSRVNRLVTNRHIPWVVWHGVHTDEIRFRGGAGGMYNMTEDLIYRYFHNIGHTLGFGHYVGSRPINANAKEPQQHHRSVMYANYKDARFSASTPLQHEVDVQAMRRIMRNYRQLIRSNVERLVGTQVSASLFYLMKAAARVA
jgi:hypothetical protein